ncbi:MAG TPA: DUF4157 domain-containing protein [Kofleriaceae bacterium]
MTTPVPDERMRLIGTGKPLEAGILARMEGFFGADFSGVRVHEGPIAEQMGALAFTLGETLYFSPGLYNIRTREGLELLGHELAHVVQQRDGRVANPYGRGVAIVQDPSLEAEADLMGQRAAKAILSGTGIGQAAMGSRPGAAVTDPDVLDADMPTESLDPALQLRHLKHQYNSLRGTSASVAATIVSGVNTARGSISVNGQQVASATGFSGHSMRRSWVSREARRMNRGGFNGAARQADAEIQVLLRLEDQIEEEDLDVYGGHLYINSDLEICRVCRRCIRVFCRYYGLTDHMSSHQESTLY